MARDYLRGRAILKPTGLRATAEGPRIPGSGQVPDVDRGLRIAPFPQHDAFVRFGLAAVDNRRVFELSADGGR